MEIWKPPDRTGSLGVLMVDAALANRAWIPNQPGFWHVIRAAARPHDFAAHGTKRRPKNGAGDWRGPRRTIGCARSDILEKRGSTKPPAPRDRGHHQALEAAGPGRGCCAPRTPPWPVGMEPSGFGGQRTLGRPEQFRIGGEHRFRILGHLAAAPSNVVPMMISTARTGQNRKPPPLHRAHGNRLPAEQKPFATSMAQFKDIEALGACGL